MRGINIGALTGRGLGILVFLAGVGVLVFVFAMAYWMFTSSVLIGDSATNAQGVTTSVIALLTRIVLLFVMILVGSLVAGKGVQMYGAVHHREPERESPKAEQNGEEES